MTIHGLPQVVPPNPYGYRAHDCNFVLDNEPYRFLAYFYTDQWIVTSIALYKMDVARRQWYKVDDIGDRALLWYTMEDAVLRLGLDWSRIAFIGLAKMIARCTSST